MVYYCLIAIVSSLSFEDHYLIQDRLNTVVVYRRDSLPIHRLIPILIYMYVYIIILPHVYIVQCGTSEQMAIHFVLWKKIVVRSSKVKIYIY